MTICPKCSGNITEAVLARQGHCTSCQYKLDARIKMRDDFAFTIVRAVATGWNGATVVKAKEFAEGVWVIADELVKQRPA